jgi:NTE family protein
MDDLGLVERVESLSPVIELESGRDVRRPEVGVALCLSGGGYRAMLFHLGAIWRINELGYLTKLDRISSVSGGSITAALLGLNWTDLHFDGSGVSHAFQEAIVEPLRRLASKTIDATSIAFGALGPRSIGEQVAESYRKYLLGQATLRDLPDRPRFVINATNVQSGALWRFMKPYMRDYRVGEVPNPEVQLATAVAASSAFPPFLSPVRLELKASDYSPPSKEDLHREPYTTDVVLTDGGVYDNLGIETAWKRYDTILVSDGGGKSGPLPEPKSDWLRQLPRILELIDNQVRSLRKRQVIDSFKQKSRSGAYWGIRTDVRHYQTPDALWCPLEQTLKLAAVATRLKRLEPPTQERLINWGYAVCDAAMRRHVLSSSVSMPTFPYPDSGVG